MNDEMQEFIVTTVKECGVIEQRKYPVEFKGGPYDGRTGELPFLPSFLVSHERDGFCGRTERGYKVDPRLSRYVYVLTHPNGEEPPYRYVIQREVSWTAWLSVDDPLDGPPKI